MLQEPLSFFYSYLISSLKTITFNIKNNLPLGLGQLKIEEPQITRFLDLSFAYYHDMSLQNRILIRIC